MKVRECFLQAVSIVPPEEDARAAWVSMNRKNAPWAAVCGEGGRLIGMMRGGEISARVAAPETFFTAGELAGEGPAAAYYERFRRAWPAALMADRDRLSPERQTVSV